MVRIADEVRLLHVLVLVIGDGHGGSAGRGEERVNGQADFFPEEHTGRETAAETDLEGGRPEPI